MTSRKFLEQVADLYMSPTHPGRLEDYVFVFPNKRSGRFLKRYMQQRVKGTSFMPRFMTIGALISRFADYPEAPRRDALFELYDAYRATVGRHPRAGAVRDFDKFIFWGEMMLADFDEIDRNGANAGQLYTNLGKLREIAADYLDDEQKKVVREIWGETAVTDSVGSFWRHIGNGDSDMTDRFLSLWEMLADIYADFSARLRARGLYTAGMQQRAALRKLKEEGRAAIADNRYVFVGFNAPTVVETLIFDELHSMGKAEFFWDTASPFIRNSDGSVSKDNASFAMLARLAERFPMPAGFKLDAIDGTPDISIIGLPSRSAQCKMASEILSSWIAEGLTDTADAINTAVIIPDESLLTTMLHSLPPEFKAVNITMGLPFSGTSFAALLQAVVSMHLRSRKIRGTWRFYHEDILEIVSHPHIRTAAAGESAAIRKHILSNNLYTMTADDLAGVAPRLSFIFTAVDDVSNIGGVRGYLTGLVDGLHGLLIEARGEGSSWEAGILSYLRGEIDDLARQIEQHDVQAGEKSYFALFERALRSHTITMEGTPLKGLQVMSVPETRALDFDNIIILSMNERVFPRRNSVKTMIPNNLRTGYGLPPTDRDENETTYHFYRLISRAKRVALIYDSRDASSGTGEASRYITQLRYLFPSDSLHFHVVGAGANAPEKRIISVEKNETVMNSLRRFLPGGSSYISASALKTFKHCGLKFYLQYVCGMRGEDEVTEYMTSAVYGTILHAAAQQIYEDYRNKPVDAAILAGLAKDLDSRYTPLVERLINKEYYHREAAEGVELPVEGQIVRDLILDFLLSMFGHEKNAWCRTAADSFTYREGELLVKGPWAITPDLNINFKMYIDRVDGTSAGLRFIDYKTGGDSTEARSVADLFRPDDSRCDAILQILAYCEAYAAMENFGDAIHPVLYTFRTMDANGGIAPIRIGGREITDYRAVSDEFLPALQQLVSDIFCETKPFTQAAEGSMACSYCVFAPMCGRVSATDDV